MTSPSANQDSYPYQNEPTWSRSEKAVARAAFDAALGRELHEVIQKAKQMANEIQQSSDLWDLEHYLTERAEKALLISDRSPGIIGVLIRAYAHAGRRTEALRLVDELKRRRQRGYVPAGAFVNAYLGIDDKEQAFAWLERAYQEKSNILQWLKVHPHFDPLRSDPRFADLLHRVDLDQAR